MVKNHRKDGVSHMGGKVNWQDRLIGMRAVEKRFISEKQLTECLNFIELFEPDKTLGQILLKKGYLTKAQIARIEEELGGEIEKPITTTVAKKMFGDIALEQNMVTSDQLTDALSLQNLLLQRGLRIQLGQILVKKGYLTIPQIKRVVEAQSNKILYCSQCKKTTTIHNYDPSQIYKCDCDCDLIEAKVKQQAVKAKKVEEDEEEEGGIEKLDVLEL